MSEDKTPPEDSTGTDGKLGPDDPRDGAKRPDDGVPGKRLGDFQLLRELGRGCLLLLLIPVLDAGPLAAHTDISPGGAHDKILAGGDLIILDVRETSEFCGTTHHIEDAVNLPWNSGVLQARSSLLPVDHEIIVVCASGGRSHQAASFLDSQGYTSVYDMLGGMSAWTWQPEFCDAEPFVRLGKSASDTEIDWTPTTGVQDYDLLRGLVGNLADNVTSVDLGSTDCLANDSPFTHYKDLDFPPPGSCHFYLPRQKDGSWGQSSRGQDRVPGSADCGLP